MENLITNFYDLSVFQFPDGTVRLTQRGYAGEDYTVDLHPSQLRLIAEQVGILEPTQPATWPRGFVRRLHRIREQADYLESIVGSVPKFPPSNELDDDERGAARLVEMLDDIMVDFGLAPDPDHEQPTTATAMAEPPKEPPKQHQQADLLTPESTS